MVTAYALLHGVLGKKCPLLSGNVHFCLVWTVKWVSRTQVKTRCLSINVRTIIAFLETSPLDKRKLREKKKCPEVQSPYNNNNKYKYSIIVRTLKWTALVWAREFGDPLVCPDQTKVDYCPD